MRVILHNYVTYPRAAYRNGGVHELIKVLREELEGEVGVLRQHIGHKVVEAVLGVQNLLAA
jgi:hypothetical protein